VASSFPNARLSPHSTTPAPISSRGSSQGCRRVGRLPRSACCMNNVRRSRVSDVSARIVARMSVSVSWNADSTKLHSRRPRRRIRGTGATRAARLSRRRRPSIHLNNARRTFVDNLHTVPTGSAWPGHRALHVTSN